MADEAPNKVTLDKGVFDTLVQSHNLLDVLAKKPTAKVALQRIIKEHVNKDYTTDEDIAAPHVQPLVDKIKELQKRLDDKDLQEVDRTIAGQIKHVADTYELTDDGVESLKKYMVEHKIADPEDAYLAWNGRKPKEPVKPTSLSLGNWNFSDATKEHDKAIWDEGELFDNYVAKIWNENRSQ